MKLPRTMKRDRKTGKVRLKHKISAKAKAADHKRKGHKMKPLAKMHMMRAIKREIATGRTKFGRRILRPKHH